MSKAMQGGATAIPSPMAAAETHQGADHMEKLAPLAGNSAVPFLTSGVWVLIALAATGLLMLAARFVFELFDLIPVG